MARLTGLAICLKTLSLSLPRPLALNFISLTTSSILLSPLSMALDLLIWSSEATILKVMVCLRVSLDQVTCSAVLMTLKFAYGTSLLLLRTNPLMLSKSLRSLFYFPSLYSYSYSILLLLVYKKIHLWSTHQDWLQYKNKTHHCTVNVNYLHSSWKTNAALLFQKNKQRPCIFNS